MERKTTISAGILTGSELMRQLRQQVIKLDLTKDISFDASNCVTIPVFSNKTKAKNKDMER